jgi:hypothetical protein
MPPPAQIGRELTLDFENAFYSRVPKIEIADREA